MHEHDQQGTDESQRDLVAAASAAAREVDALRREMARLREEHAHAQRAWARGNLQFAVAMVQTLDARDSYTAGHSAAVAVYTADMARWMGLDTDDCQRAHLAGLLHDIGKIGIRDEILNKQGILDMAEIEHIKTHPVIGAEVLARVDAYSDLAILVRHHHERIDGRGYPDGIAGDDIPVVSRMIAVADTYSAMTTDRPYRDGMPPERAREILAAAAEEGQLDPLYTRSFLRILTHASEAYQRGKLDTFEVQAAQHQALGNIEVFVPPSTGADPAVPASHALIDLEAAPGVRVRELTVDDSAAFLAGVAADRSALGEWEPWALDMNTVDDVRARLEVQAARRGPNRNFGFGIFQDDEVVGMVWLTDVDSGRADAGVWAAGGDRHLPVAVLALERIADWAFSKQSVERITLTPYVGHAWGCSVAEQVGFRATGRTEKADFFHGRWHDTITYEMTGSEWFRRTAYAAVQRAA